MENPGFSRHLFWETDYDQIDWDGKWRYVIERVVCYGDLSDWRRLQTRYGMKKIKEAILDARDLDPLTLNWMSDILNVPKSDFRCFKLKQLNPVHWDY